MLTHVLLSPSRCANMKSCPDTAPPAADQDTLLDVGSLTGRPRAGPADGRMGVLPTEGSKGWFASVYIYLTHHSILSGN